MSELKYKTLDIKPLTDQIHRVRLSPVNSDVFDFEGGQYLLLEMPDGAKIPLSIASAPEEKSFIELHIRITHTESLAAEMLAHFRESELIGIDGPHGSCTLPKGDKPVIVIAGGTGFSPAKSILESAFVQCKGREFALYFGAQKASEIYQSPIIEAWQTERVSFSYTPVVIEKESWQGEVGFPHEVAMKDYAERLSGCEFIVCGSEPMVMNVYRSLTQAGVPSSQILSDILDIKRASGEEL